VFGESAASPELDLRDRYLTSFVTQNGTSAQPNPPHAALSRPLQTAANIKLALALKENVHLGGASAADSKEQAQAAAAQAAQAAQDSAKQTGAAPAVDHSDDSFLRSYAHYLQFVTSHNVDCYQSPWQGGSGGSASRMVQYLVWLSDEAILSSRTSAVARREKQRLAVHNAEMEKERRQKERELSAIDKKYGAGAAAAAAAAAANADGSTSTTTTSAGATGATGAGAGSDAAPVQARPSELKAEEWTLIDAEDTSLLVRKMMPSLSLVRCVIHTHAHTCLVLAVCMSDVLCVFAWRA
jgi:hypothetical protein